MKKIIYLTGSRAEFGLMSKILTGIETDKDLQLILLATGMHLLPEFGNTINEIKAVFPQVKILDATYEKDDRLSMARFLGRAVCGITEALNREKPDLILVLGDRAEQLAMAQTAAYLAIPIIHLHGGEKTTTIDDKTRNAVSMLADWHLPATTAAVKKLTQMSIDQNRINIVGAPGLDQIKDLPPTNKKDSLVVLQHPDEEDNDAAWQIKQTLEADMKFKLPVKVIYPNADAGGRNMIKVINEYKNRVEIYPSVGRAEFLKLLSKAKVLVGNSSSGIIEAPSFNLPFVNIGPRQSGREQAKNVINVSYDKNQIARAIEKGLNWRLKNITNPYGDGHTAERVLKFLKNL